MAENEAELRKIAWSQAFPFVRLFHTLRLALGFKRLTLALACVLLLYIGGRVLDWVWGPANGAAAKPGEGGTVTEVQVYTQRDHAGFHTWVSEANDEQEQRGFVALRDARLADSLEEARQLLRKQSLRELLIDSKQKSELADLRALIDKRLEAGLAALTRDTKLSDTERTDKRRDLIDAADTLRKLLHGTRARAAGGAAQGQRAIETLVAADPEADALQRSKDQARLTAATARLGQLRQYENLVPKGPFISLLMHESHCLAAAIQGVCSGRWGFQAGAYDPQPAMCGSIESAVRGVCWLLNQHPWYALFFGVYSLLVAAVFGGAICRSAAVQAAREESISLGEALGFVRQRYGGFILAPLLPIGVFVGIALLMFIGGLIGAIGYVGELFTGVFYPLALLGGFALAVIVLATLLGFHLMWPTIAVEGSDGFDALSRACSYVGSRIWHLGFYTFVLLLFGGVATVLARVVAVLTLKLAHKFTGLGMNLISGAELSGVGKLSALWAMPAWADLPLLPSTGDVPFWGTFANGPLDGTERVAAWLIALWVYLTVALLGAFVVSFFFCGSTQIYFLLRRDVDATDYDEVYYEEPAEELPPATPAAPSGATTETAGAAEESRPAGDTSQPVGDSPQPEPGPGNA